MTIASKRELIARLAVDAGLGRRLPPANGLPDTWYGTDLDALERFFDAAAEIRSMRELQLMSERLHMPAAVAAEREACAQVARRTATHLTTPYGDGYNQAAIDIEAGIRARGAP